MKTGRSLESGDELIGENEASSMVCWVVFLVCVALLKVYEVLWVEEILPNPGRCWTEIEESNERFLSKE